jgi:hypothetical protein
MISGVILTFLSFFILGLVENGTLIYVAQALVFAGAVYGVNVYYGTKFGDYESRTNYNIEETIKKYIHKYINEDLKNSKKDK